MAPSSGVDGARDTRGDDVDAAFVAAARAPGAVRGDCGGGGGSVGVRSVLRGGGAEWVGGGWGDAGVEAVWGVMCVGVRGDTLPI